MTRKKPTVAQMRSLWNHTVKFVDTHEISCPETVYQTDRVIENAYEFIETAGKLVGWFEYPEDA